MYRSASRKTAVFPAVSALSMVVASALLASCSTHDEVHEKAGQAVEQAQEITEKGSNLAEIINAKVLDHAWFGTRVTANRYGQPFPTAWEKPGVVFSSTGGISLTAFAEKMTQHLGVPVVVDLAPPATNTKSAKDGSASTPASSSSHGEDPNSSTRTATANVAASGAPPGVVPAGLTQLINHANASSPNGARPAVPGTASNLATGSNRPDACTLKFPETTMPMSRRLMYVDGVCGVRSTYDGYRIVIRRYVEALLPVASFSSEDSYQTSMGNSNNGNVSTSTTSSTTGNISSSGSLTVSTSWKDDPYKELSDGLKARLPSGSIVTPNPSAHGITVVSTPDAVDRARAYVDTYNRTVSRMINVRIEILQANVSASDSYGVDLTASLANKWSGLNFGLSGPASGLSATGNSAGCASVAVPKTGYQPQVAALAGSSFAACALSKEGRARVVANKLIPIHNGKTYVLDETAIDDYISGTSSQGVTTTGVITPTSITTSTTFYGTKLMIQPILLPDGLVRMRIRPIIQGKPTFVTAGSDSATVQLRQDQEVREYTNEVSVQNGSTVVAYATLDDNSSTDDAGVGSAQMPLFGGHVSGSKLKSAFVILVTPTEVDPLGRPTGDVGIVR